MPNFAASGPDQGPDQNNEGIGLQTVADELLWEFRRFWPAPGVSIPSISTELHILQVKATRADSTTLNAGELAQIGLEIAFHESESPFVWIAMEPDDARNASVQPGSTWYFFRVLLGPDAEFSLADGAYLVTVRTALPPRAARNMPLLTIDPPIY